MIDDDFSEWCEAEAKRRWAKASDKFFAEGKVPGIAPGEGDHDDLADALNLSFSNALEGLSMGYTAITETASYPNVPLQWCLTPPPKPMNAFDALLRANYRNN